MSLDALISSMPAGPSLTAALDIPRTAGTVSAVIATYNRCAFDPAHGRLRDNPLTWALDSLLAQAGHALAEIVVADDGSADHTPAVLDTYLSRQGPVPVREVRLASHRGAWAARNAATDAATSRWLLFGDDDCVFAPHYAAGAAYAMDRLSARDPAAAAVMLPFYYRVTRPHQTTPARQIGRLDPALAQFATWFHTWPREYSPDPPRLDRTGLTARCASS
jgi:glycosyltransferase involved in cell wall biosynthesis